jgi:hypothetical protein
MSDLVDALSDINTQGETAMNDAIYVSLDYMKKGSREKKALARHHRWRRQQEQVWNQQAIEHIRESKDVTIYSIGLLEENDERGGLFGKSPAKKAKDDLTKISEMTGGEAYFPKSIDEVTEICKKIARDLRNQYTIGYTPSNTKNDGGDRAIRVAVTPPPGTAKINIRARSGYTAPTP